MRPIIQQLQIDAANDQASASQLLRKAKIAATKLGLNDFLEWINNELDGYKSAENTRGGNKKLPEYRIISVDLRGRNPFHGWVPVMFTDTETQKNMNKRCVSQSIGEIEKISQSDEGSLQIPLCIFVSLQKIKTCLTFAGRQVFEVVT